MSVTPSGIVISFRAEQFSKAEMPMDVTPFGSSMLSRLVHPLKADDSMVVMLSGRETSERLLQLSNA